MVFLNLFYFQPRLVSVKHSQFQVVSKTVGLQFVDSDCISSLISVLVYNPYEYCYFPEHFQFRRLNAILFSFCEEYVLGALY